MKLKIALVLMPLVIVILVHDAVAKEWRGIIPLHSNRADVVRRFSQCVNTEDSCSIRIGNEDAYIVFAGAAMNGKYECVRRLPSDTVLHVEVELHAPRKMSELGISKRNFVSFAPSAAPDNVYHGYVDRHEGLIIETHKGRVKRLYYIAAETDVPVCQGYYEKPEAFLKYPIVLCCPPISMTCPSVSLEGDHLVFSAVTLLLRRATYKWHISDGRIIDGQGTLRIKVDTMGAGGRKLKATLEMRGGKNDESPTSFCEVFVTKRPGS